MVRARIATCELPDPFTEIRPLSLSLGTSASMAAVSSSLTRMVSSLYSVSTSASVLQIEQDPRAEFLDIYRPLTEVVIVHGLKTPHMFIGDQARAPWAQ